MNNHHGCPYPINPLAKAFPPLDPAQFEHLLASIRERGLRRPIAVWRGEIIDGVHRLKACIDAGVEPRYEFLDDDEDPYEYLADVNIPRRGMTQNEKALTAHLMSQYSTPGRPRSSDENSANVRSISQGKAAKLVGVSPRLVSYASRVLSSGSKATPMVQDAVLGWKVKCSDAARVVDLPPEVQNRAMDLVDRGEIKTVKSAVQRVEQELALSEEEAARLEILARPLDDTIVLYIASVADLPGRVTSGIIDAVISHPPHTEEALPLLAHLASFAAHALKPSGVMVVVGNGIILPRMLERLEHRDLGWLAEFDLVFHGKPVGSGPPHYMRLHRRPVLVYGKGQVRLSGTDDLFEVPPRDALPRGITEQEAAMALLVQRFCRAGNTICDPVMLDRAGTALAARRLGCTFIGATEIQSCSDRIQVRLAQAEKEREDIPASGSET